MNPQLILFLPNIPKKFTNCSFIPILKTNQIQSTCIFWITNMIPRNRGFPTVTALTCLKKTSANPFNMLHHFLRQRKDLEPIICDGK